MTGVRLAALGLAALVVGCGPDPVADDLGDPTRVIAPEAPSDTPSEIASETRPSDESGVDAGSTPGGREDASVVDAPAHWPDRLVLGIAPVAMNQASAHLRRLEALLADELGIPVITRVAGSRSGVAQDLASGHADVIVGDLFDVVIAHDADAPVEILDADVGDQGPAHRQTAVTIVLQAVRSGVTAEPMVWIASAPDGWCAGPATAVPASDDALQACSAIADAVAELYATSTSAAEVVPTIVRGGDVTILVDASTAAREHYVRDHLARLLPSEVLDEVTIEPAATRRRWLDGLEADLDAVGIVGWTSIAAIGSLSEGTVPVVVGIAPAVPHEVVAVRQGLPHDLVVRIAEGFDAAAATPWAAQALLDLVGVEGWVHPESTTLSTARRVAGHQIP